MKFNIVTAAFAAMTALALGACSEGQYWTEPSELHEAVAFAKPAVRVVVGSDEEVPSSYEVTISRTNPEKELTVPVTFTTKTPDVLSGPESVTFKAGAGTATYTISIKQPVMPVTTYSATLEVEPMGGNLHVDEKNLSFSFQLFQSFDPEWSAAGTADITSYAWVGEDVTESVKVEESPWPITGERLFRLIDVYYALEPEYAESGSELAFITDADGNPLRLYQTWNYIGEYDEDGNYFFFGGVGVYQGTSFTRSGDTYEMAGVIGYGPEDGSSMTPYTMETLVFDWACPAAK